MQRGDDPLVGKRGSHHKYEYFLLRDAKQLLTPEERRERYNARARARNAKRPKTASKPLELKPLVKPKSNPKPLPKQFRTRIEAGVEQAQAKKTERAHRTEYQSVEEFLARGGVIERL
jgi:hypothetical protein